MINVWKFVVVIATNCIAQHLALETVNYKPLGIGPIKQDFAGDFKLFSQQTSELYRKSYIELTKVYNEFDYHVSINNERHESICSGALIRGDLVVTAASCNIQATYNINIKSIYRSSGGWSSGIKCVNNHPLYRTGKKSPAIVQHKYDYDIAVLHLQKDFSGLVDNILEVVNNPDFPGFATLTGYSQYSESVTKNALMYSELPKADCSKYGYKTTSNMFCAGFFYDRKSYCNEDRGNPLVIGKTLIGIRSFGTHCSRVILPSVFTAIQGDVYKFLHQNLIAPKSSSC